MNINMTLFAQALMFAGFIWVIARFIWPPLLTAIEDRQKKIADGLAAADKARAELAAADTRVQEEVKAARSKASEIIEKANQTANQMIDKAKEDALAEAARQRAAALAEIDSLSNRAKEELRKQVASLAIAGAEKILKREIDQAAHKAILDQLAAEI